MYFSIGWPKLLDSKSEDSTTILQIEADRVKILFCILFEDSLSIWFCKPNVPITHFKRSDKCLTDNGINKFIQWKPDSSKLVVAVSDFFCLFFDDLDVFFPFYVALSVIYQF